MMSAPESLDEFAARLRENTDLETCNLWSGEGMPCPFCGAPGFTSYPLFVHQENKLPHPPLLCQECRRIGRFFFESATNPFDLTPTHYYVLQMSGPAQPTWFFPKIGWVL